MINNRPKVSIGMPVYNAEKYLRESLDSLVSQTFIDFELIISDNASSDGSSDICVEYSKKDKRISYFRQPINISGWENFRYVLNEAKGDYFMWSAANDLRSLDFVELNFNFLSLNPEYVASTSPNIQEGDNEEKDKVINFALKQNDNFQRYVFFFDHCWQSHGIFYSLIRLSELKECPLLRDGSEFFGVDRGVNLFLASKGKINRTIMGQTIFGNNGTSQKPNFLKNIRTSYIEFYFPFYKLNMYVLDLIKPLSLIKRVRVMLILLSLNARFNFDRFKAQLKQFLR